jgi:NOL1/NOP2/sun family putative RNA methylase
MPTDVHNKKYLSLFYSDNRGEWRGLAEKFGVLDYMVERYVQMLGRDGAEMFLSSCLIPPKKSIRCNDLKIDCQRLQEVMEEKGFKFSRISWIPHGLLINNAPSSPSLGATLEYLKGYYYIQGLASMLPPYALHPSPTDTVLDLAAAPGGKTTYLSQLMHNNGLVLALEKKRNRMRGLLSNINRMGATNVVLLRGDASIAPKLGINFDKILLDAPCSGEGLLGKDPSRRTKTTLSRLREFQEEQMKLIKYAALSLKKDGLMVYSTCSVAPEEDEAVIDFAVEHIGLHVVDPKVKVGEPGITEFKGVSFDPSVKMCRRLYPHLHGTEGFFLCLLSK